MSQEWITTRQAAELTGYHPEYLRELIRNGHIHAQKFGTIWQVDKQSLLNYLQANTISDDKRRGPQ